MTDEQQSGKGGGFMRTVAKKALGPIVASAATAVTAFLVRKGTQLWQERLQPMIDEKGGGRAAASEALGGVAQRLPAQASDKLEALASKVTFESPETERSSASSDSPSDPERDEERRKREQRREQRRRSLEHARSS